MVTSTPSGVPNDQAERLGELAATGLIALPIGMLWLAKGWKLIITGLSPQQPVDAPDVASPPVAQKSSGFAYISLFTGVLVLTVWAGLLTFSAFSDSVYAFHEKSSTSSSTVSPIYALMLLTLWPYASWASILRREPNTVVDNVKRHKLVTAIVGAMFTIPLCVAITFGVQNGTDRRLTARIKESTKDFGDIANKIGSIKGRQLQTTQDYIDAYEEIDPLLVQFDQRFQRFNDIANESKQLDSTRGPLNIQRLYRGHNQEIVWNDQIFDLLRQDIDLTRKQVAVVRQMEVLPQDSQVDYWRNNFQPLREQEDVLRNKIAVLMQHKPGLGN